jgi:sialate O-acetylesterase
MGGRRGDDFWVGWLFDFHRAWVAPKTWGVLRPVLFLLCAALPCLADITLPPLISDNMVLEQRTRPTIWGRADPGESITVKLGEDTAQTVADKEGTWSVKLDGLKAGGPYEMNVSGKNAITVHNIAIGEVWLCAGESNMEYPVVAARDSQQEMAAATLPMLRVFMVKHNAAAQPQRDCAGEWIICDPGTVGPVSAVAFFFGRDINRGMRTPVGLIESAWGPSRAEAWTPRAELEKDFKPLLDDYQKRASAYPAAFTAYHDSLSQWKASAHAPGSHAPVAPVDPSGPNEPASLYNGMIAPLTRYAIRGALWYQGESNTSDPGTYRTLFPAMIGAWRAAFKEGDFPFLYVQLAGFLRRHEQPVASRWAELREAQAAALSTNKTGMAVAVDLGDEHDMHPADKQDVSHRLTLIASSEVYGKPVAASGPVFSGMSIDDGKATISFSHTEGGLAATTGTAVKGFSIAGEDRNFVWAEAEIHGTKVIVQSASVPNPVAVRYAWADMPDCDLVNKVNLPAAPFRTDTWVAGEFAPPAPAPTPAKRVKRRAEE